MPSDVRAIRIRWGRVAALLIALSAVAAVIASRSPAASPPAPPRAEPTGGAVPADTSVFDDVPAVANLDPALRRALRRAATDAARDHVAFVVNSGWRSAAYQRKLRREAIARYGSAREAARWVASPSRSEHVLGRAVDIGPADAQAWLSAHGAAYGLCPVYRNEPWHFERLGPVCPPLYADAAHDPRMQENP